MRPPRLLTVLALCCMKRLAKMIYNIPKYFNMFFCSNSGMMIIVTTNISRAKQNFECYRVTVGLVYS